MTVAEHQLLTAEQQEARLDAAAERLEDAAPQDILRWAVEQYGGSLALACSFGMQSVVIAHMLAETGLLRRVEAFYLDTGVLFSQTHQTRLRVQARYGFLATRVAPELSWAEQQIKFGGHLYERGVEGINACCFLRKVEPMRLYFQRRGFGAWITGMRRSHSQVRADVPVVMWDGAHGMAKINPLAALDNETLWGYIHANGIPYNPLYDQGYKSIGCDTPICTQPVADGDDDRAGRWSGAKTECGIHADGRVIKSLDSSQL